jgi:alpha-ribazole phosphatase
MDLYLIRHPAAAVEPEVCYGASDLPLAGPLASTLRHLRALLPKDATIYSSPLQRALLLANRLGAATVEPRLREIDFGAWELKRFDEIGVDALDRWAADPLGHRPPGGESALEMAARVLGFLHELRDEPPQGPVVIVAHGGPLRAIVGHLLGLPQDRWLALEFECAKLTHLVIADYGVSLRLFNR